MLQPALGFQINPSDQTIRLGPLVVRFLITGENSNGSIAIFGVGVPGCPAPDQPSRCAPQGGPSFPPQH